MDKLNILLWSSKGASTAFYGGGPIAAFRLYQNRDPATTRLALAHGRAEQPPHPEVFDEQHFVTGLWRPADFARNGSGAGGAPHAALLNDLRLVAAKANFIARARGWLQQNANRYDVFHGIGIHADALTPAVCAHAAGMPTVMTTLIEGELNRPSRFASLCGLYRRRMAELRAVSAVVAISSNIHRRLLEAGVHEDRIVDLPLAGVDTELFQPIANLEARAALRAELGVADRPTCLFAGTIQGRKRPHLLVPALAEMRARGLDLQLLLAGPEHDKGYAQRMRAEAERLGVAEHIVWYGFTRRMSELMRAAELLALPSEDEGMPGVVMEAMASGIPCIYTDISGARDAIDDGVNGAIIPADGSGLADALAGYLGEPARMAAHGRAAREKAERQFSNRVVLERYLRIFDNVRRLRPPGA
ncbi:putative enzyme [uncultured Defluviicoccus sp.]|uniref:Putative enzyme n=1 Tax=metagenome TaxID=256318 RepID=A0A380T9U5_9ZZZZ|nr:putative enzyme [uncultured Defluviicoccus sp.]